MEAIPLSEVAKLGGLGTLLGITIWVAWQLKTDLVKCFQERIADWKAVGEVLHTATTTVAALTQESAARTRAQENTAMAMAALTQEVGRLREQAIEMKSEISRLRNGSK
jgi:hypothetical protein